MSTRNILLVAIVFFLLVTFPVLPRSVILSPNATCAEFESVVEAAERRPDLDFIHESERAQICDAVYHNLKRPYKCPDYDWQRARRVLRCDTAAEGPGFPPHGTMYHTT